MLFNSFEFLIFFPAVAIVYLIIPKKTRTSWLLIASYAFCISWKPQFAIALAASTIVTFITALLIEKNTKPTLRRTILGLGIVVMLATLVIFKYTRFISSTVNSFSIRLGAGEIARGLDLLLPIGISFYTLQNIGYMIDVYRKDITAEKNIINFAVFVSFFPKLMSGPIEQYKKFLPQIRAAASMNLWNADRIRSGIALILWGLFQKLVIADRANLLVIQVYDHYSRYGFVEIALATVLFAIVIYCDFAGYTCIARGTSRIMGFELTENFRQPYFATNIDDFWKRWHISLTSWFTNYLYIPLGGNRKGTFRKYINIFIVFVLSGLWHGAGWNYIAWGLIHAVYKIIRNIRIRLIKRKSKDTVVKRILCGIATFIMVDLAWLFFAVGSLGQARGMLRSATTHFMTTHIDKLGLDLNNWIILLVALIVLIVVDVLRNKKISIATWLNACNACVRVLCFLMLVWTIIMLGIYGVGYDTSQFIYAQF